MNNIPIHVKPFLNVTEAVEYFGIGKNKIMSLTDENKDLVVYNGNKRLIKREKMFKFLNESYSI